MHLLTSLLIIGYLYASIYCIPIEVTTVVNSPRDTTIRHTAESLSTTSTVGYTLKDASISEIISSTVFGTTDHKGLDETATELQTENASISAITPSTVFGTTDHKGLDEIATEPQTENTSTPTSDIPTTMDVISTTIFETTESEETTTMPPKPKVKRPKCGPRFTRIPHIVGGSDSLAGEFPWAVSVRLLTTHHCGGIIINKNWVLTAGHCAKRFAPRYYRIRLGGFNVNFDGYRPMYDLRVSDVIVYPRFGSPARYSYDIALLKLARSIGPREFAAPVCLPENPDETYVGWNVTVVGWGRTSHLEDAMAKVLQKAVIPVINNSYCDQLYAEAHHTYIQVREFQLCAGERGKDSCKGDSGGPLVVLDEQGRYTLIGVVSAGLGCGELELPGIYSRVSYFVPWINQVTGGYTVWPPEEEEYE